MAKPPGAGTFHWHQDNAYSELVDPYVQAWLALTPSRAEHGGLQVVPGSHRRGLLAHRWSDPDQVYAGRPTDTVVIDAEPGDLVLFSSYLLHGTPPNRSASTRWAYVAEFMRLRDVDPTIEPPYLVVARGGVAAPELVPVHPAAGSVVNRLKYSPAGGATRTAARATRRGVARVRTRVRDRGAARGGGSVALAPDDALDAAGLERAAVACRQDAVEGSARILPIVFELFGVDSVLDVGCGSGVWLSVAADLGARRLTGIDTDWSADAADRAATFERPGFTFVGHDLRSPLPVGRARPARSRALPRGRPAPSRLSGRSLRRGALRPLEPGALRRGDPAAVPVFVGALRAGALAGMNEFPGVDAARDRALVRVRAALGDAETDRLLDEGAAMTYDDLVAYTLEHLRSPAEPDEAPAST